MKCMDNHANGIFVKYLGQSCRSLQAVEMRTWLASDETSPPASRWKYESSTCLVRSIFALRITTITRMADDARKTDFIVFPEVRSLRHATNWIMCLVCLSENIFVQLHNTRGVRGAMFSSDVFLEYGCCGTQQIEDYVWFASDEAFPSNSRWKIGTSMCFKRSFLPHESTGDIKFCWIHVAVACNRFNSASGFPQTKHLHSIA